MDRKDILLIRNRSYSYRGLRVSNLVKTQETIQQLQELQVIDDEVPIFKPRSFDIKRRECVWLYGNNGCGK